MGESAWYLSPPSGGTHGVAAGSPVGGTMASNECPSQDEQRGVQRRATGPSPASPNVAVPASPRRVGFAGADGMPDTLEAELAERLDTVLNIAERLAATHDRHELLRTIVDETRRALRVDYVDHPGRRGRPTGGRGVGRSAEKVARALPVHRCRRRVGRGGPRTGPDGPWSDTRSDPRHGAERPEGIVETAGDLIAP